MLVFSNTLRVPARILSIKIVWFTATIYLHVYNIIWTTGLIWKKTIIRLL